MERADDLGPKGESGLLIVKECYKQLFNQTPWFFEAKGGTFRFFSETMILDPEIIPNSRHKIQDDININRGFRGGKF